MKRIFMISFCAVLTGLLLWFWWMGTAKRQFPGWEIVSGSLEEAPSAPGGESSPGKQFLATGTVHLAREDASVVLLADSLVEFSKAAKEPAALVLPLIFRGEMVVTAGKPFLLKETLFTPAEIVHITITPLWAKVLKGSVNVQGRCHGPGSTIVLHKENPLVKKSPLPGESPEPGGIKGPQSIGEQPPTGQVMEARAGQPIAGVQVRATFSHSVDGYPPLPAPGSQVTLMTDATGHFRVPPFHPEDPRLKLHLLLEHPAFLPEVFVIEKPHDLKGDWPFTTLSLRQAMTCSILFLDPEDSPLPGLAVRVDDYPKDSFLGEDTWEEGRTFDPRRPAIHYTGEDGTLRLWQGGVTLTLHHSFLHVEDIELLQPLPLQMLPDSFPAVVVSLNLSPRTSSGFPADLLAEIHTGAQEPGAYWLQDREGNSVANSLLEIELEEIPPVRFYTDASGGFFYTPPPPPRGEGIEPFSPEAPARGILTVLSPLYWKQNTPVQFPSRAERIFLAGKPGGRLRLRAREDLGAETDPQPIPSGGIQISEELTLVRRSADGEAIYEGILPKTRAEMLISLKGFLPSLARIPAHVPGDPFLDLGEVLFHRGRTLSLKVLGGNPAIYHKARFHIADREWPTHYQIYPLGDDGQALLGGLEAGRTYTYAIEGSRIERLEGEFLAEQELFQDGLTIPLVSREEVEILLQGLMVGARPVQSSTFRVVERYFVDGEDNPRVFLSYPLAPDGLIGSTRILPLPQRAEVFVVGPGHQVGHAERTLLPDRLDFDMGKITPRESYHASFSFRVEGLGKVYPPFGLTLFAEENRNHEIARLDFYDRIVVIDNLLPGEYFLRWGGDSQEEEEYVFQVIPGQLEIQGEIPRRPLDRELVEFRITDSAGKPVEGVRITSSGGDFPESRSSSEGLYQVEVLTRKENRFRIAREGFLPANLVLPAGAAVPDPVVLQRGVRVQALVKDAGGRRFEGNLNITFRSEIKDEEGMAVLQIAPLSLNVIRGELDSLQFPPGSQEITFRDTASDAKFEGFFELSPRQINDLGTLVLRETRALSGIVLLPGGDPAPEAQVSLVKPGEFYRFPKRSPDPEKVVFSAKATPLGRFRIDGLPLDLQEELDLVAHLPGWTDAVERPVDLDLEEHMLVLSANTQLAIDAGYGDSGDFEDYEFRLEYREDMRTNVQAIQLGPLLPGPPGGRIYAGITPGIYRLIWNLKEGHHLFEPRAAEAVVAPGVPAALSLRIHDRILPGEAFLNQELLNRGWLILILCSGNAVEIAIGRVRDGSFQVAVPLRMERAHGSLIPERKPALSPSFYRGECLPREIEDFRGALRRRFLSFHYEAHDLTVELPAGYIRNSPDAEIEFPHYLWSSGSYRKEKRSEPLQRSPYSLQLIPPGPFSLRISGRGGTFIFPTIEINQDTTLSLGK